MTEFTSQSYAGDQHQKQLNVHGGSRRTRNSFSAVMVTTSLMADDCETGQHGNSGYTEHNSSVRRFFKRKFSVGSTD